MSRPAPLSCRILPLLALLGCGSEHRADPAPAAPTQPAAAGSAPAADPVPAAPAASAAPATDAAPAEAAVRAPEGPQPGSDEFVAYREQIGDTGVGFDMVPIGGGDLVMGSPPTEPGRRDDEGPQLAVRVAPFWMGRCEVTWAEYDTWNTDESRPQSKLPDGVARPTPPYMDMTFNMGRDGYPAICMSHVAARQYCKWLSEKTGHFYRLPTEAEWEYACRAGSTTAWSIGDDPAALGDVAWFAGNSARELDVGAAPEKAYHQVGQKAPNAFGLCDMHGNVAEWVADAYLADAYAPEHGAAPRVDPYFAPARDHRDRPVRFSHVVRGGSWRDEPAQLRSAARLASDADWNQRDPQVPKSWWYLTEGQHVGFRVVRPWREPDPDTRARFENP